MCPTGALSIQAESGMSGNPSIFKPEFSFHRERLLLDCGQPGSAHGGPGTPTGPSGFFVLGETSRKIFNPNLQKAMEMAAEKLGVVCNPAQAVKLFPSHNVAEVAVAEVCNGAKQLSLEYSDARIPGMPMELALACVDKRLRQEGLRSNVSLIAGGYLRCSTDVLKIIALGADAVNIGEAALAAVGCTLCGHCHTGKCPWGIATNDPKLRKRQNPEVGAEQITDLVYRWSREIGEMLVEMGVDSHKKLCGDRSKLRAVGLSENAMEILEVKHAGQ
ncbi:hypothetical protein FMR86_11870 [Desulfovibrio sp. JC010]|nr:hypothetical protein [Desulfovibrio sp. JC010]